jgi:hypothetical protein
VFSLQLPELPGLGIDSLDTDWLGSTATLNGNSLVHLVWLKSLRNTVEDEFLSDLTVWKLDSQSSHIVNVLEMSPRWQLSDKVEWFLDNEAVLSAQLSLDWVSWNFVNIIDGPSLILLFVGRHPLHLSVGISLEMLTLSVNHMRTSEVVKLPPS